MRFWRLADALEREKCIEPPRVLEPFASARTELFALPLANEIRQ
jgi:hypothetical protein